MDVLKLALKDLILPDVISLDQKRPISDETRRRIIRQRKAAAFRQTFYCKACNQICARCGGQLTQSILQKRTPDPTVPYRFCEICAVDYKDYIAVLQGNRETGCDWHNDQWLSAWRCWIDYQGAVDSFRKSKEFRKLLNEDD